MRSAPSGPVVVRATVDQLATCMTNEVNLIAYRKPSQRCDQRRGHRPACARRATHACHARAPGLAATCASLGLTACTRCIAGPASSIAAAIALNRRNEIMLITW